MSPQRDPGAVGEVGERLREVHLVIVHHEAEGIPGGPAGVALVEAVALVGHHRQRRGVIVVEGADADVLAPLGFQGEVLADQLDQIGGLVNEVDVGFSVDPGHVQSP